MLTEAENETLASATAAQRDIVQTLRQTILGAHSTATVMAWPRLKIISFGFGPKKMSQHYAYLALHKRHVNLGFYQGARLAAAPGVLEGTGKLLRHVKIETAEAAKHPGLKTLIVAAIKLQQDLLTGANQTRREPE
ncbi:MAG: DUF1801 domain-containing protein [Xanthomonadales bacterium]|nr:DUF1801 domain-containing protein [Xanthomonadales bacterium]